MANYKTILKRTAIGTAAFLIGLPLLLFAINAFDEELLPEAVAYADLSDLRVPDEENAYFSWIALTVPANEDPHIRGMEIAAATNRQLSDNPTEMPDPLKAIGPGRLRIAAELKSLCGRESTDCLVRYRAQQQTIERAIAQHRLLLKRYRALYRFRYLRDTITPHIFAPMMVDSSSAAQLARAESALHFLQGDIRRALRQLRDDTLFWRNVLRDSPSLVTRMIAVAMVQTNANLVSEMVASGALNDFGLRLAADIVTPLTKPERNLDTVFRFEFALHKSILFSVGEQLQTDCAEITFYDCALSYASGTVFFRRNSTLNDSYQLLQAIVDTSRQPADEFLRRATEAIQKAHLDAKVSWKWHYFYNPVGKLFNAIAHGGTFYFGYMVRIHNLDGFLRLVASQIRLRQSHANDDRSREEVIAHSADLHNPYTGKPMGYDGRKRIIVFLGCDDRSPTAELSKRFEIKL